MNPAGHEYLTNEAIAAATKDFPPQLGWLKRMLKETLVGAVYIDVEDVFTRGHWRPDGQRHHFMRFAGQSPIAAYNAALQWIHDNARASAVEIRKIIKTHPRMVDPVVVTAPLGEAIHALEDSYAAGHATRVKDGIDFVITDVHVYDDANKQKRDDWPGHEALDEKWKTDELGKEAVIAARELIRLAVVTSIVKVDSEFDPKFESLWDTFTSMFLQSRLAP